MAYTVEYRITLIDHLRTVIGDEERNMFTDAQLDAYLRGRAIPGLWTEQIAAYKNHFYSGRPGPVLDLNVTSGVSGSSYRVDESCKHVQWISGSSEPATNDKIEISYINLNFIGAVRDILLIIATDRSKLAARSQTGDIVTDMRVLRAEIMRQVQDLGVIEKWEQE